MEKKTKHRILGALVVIALVIILLPLFQSGREISPEKVIVKAPPFPDQTMQVPSIPATAEAPAPEQKEPAPASNNAQSENDINRSDDLMSISRPSVVDSKIPIKNNAQDNKTNPPELHPVLSEQNTSVIQLPDGIVPSSNKSNSQTSLMKPTIKKTPHIIKHDQNLKIQTASATKIKNNNDVLLKLKDSAWVIQIGSFKNKANALRLVNQLRAKGYRAFIQQISTTFGENTRVFVGPENKHTSARALASKLENEMHIRGVIISYKPLTL